MTDDNTEINNMHYCLNTELRALPGWRRNKYAGYNFLTRIQKPETVDFDIIC